MTQRQLDRLGQIRDFDIRLIRVFQAVAENGGFTAAVPTLGVSRSAISLHMANLEARTGLKLCQRGRSGFALTEEGRELYEASLRLLTAIETFRTEVNSLHHQLRGTLNIGITDSLVSLPYMQVTNALSALKAHGPEVHININMIPPDEVERGVMDGRLHVGVVPVINQMAVLDYQPLYAETAYLYCAAGHPLFQRDDSTIRPSEIAKADAVMPAYALPPAGHESHQALNGTATANDREGIAFLVLTDRYIGYLPEHFARRWAETKQLRALKPEEHHYRLDYATITRHGRRPHRVLETFLQEVTRS